jgi:hypothetical protein
LAGSEQAGDGRGAGAEFFDEFTKPAGELAAFGGEGGEPHLPVESGLKRGDLGWETVRGAGLVAEEEGLPVGAVGAVFEDEFGAADGHNGKEAVARGEMPRSKNSFPRTKDGQSHAGGESGGGEENREGDGELDGRGEGTEVAPRHGGPRQGNFFRAEEMGPVSVVDEGEREGGGKEVKVSVVAGEGDKEHEGEKG